jgi:hypothetical protein
MDPTHYLATNFADAHQLSALLSIPDLSLLFLYLFPFCTSHLSIHSHIRSRYHVAGKPAISKRRHERARMSGRIWAHNGKMQPLFLHIENLLVFNGTTILTLDEPSSSHALLID